METHDRARLTALLDIAAWKHQHLDWHSPMDFVDRQPFVVALEGERTVGCLACPPDPPGVSWIRLFAVAPGYPLQRAWQALWKEAIALTRSAGTATAAALPVVDWLPPLLELSGFHRQLGVLFLEWRGHTPPLDQPCPAAIRSMRSSDLDVVALADRRAFGPLWHLSRTSLAAALAQSEVASVAELDSRVIGYQLCTGSALGAHLARLAVEPGLQRQGVGRALAVDALRALVQRGFSKVTVNTQTDNAPSRRLYQRLGFKETDQEYPVYQLEIASSHRLRTEIDRR